MAALALRRYRPLAVAALWLIGWAIAINLVLIVLARTPVLGRLPDGQTGTGFVNDNRQRVAGALADYRAGNVARGDYLVAVTGISNVREAVDVDILRARLGPDVRVLGVAGAGAGAPAIVENAGTLLDSALRPDVVVLGIAPLHMVDTLVTPGATPAGLPQPTLRERVRELVRQGVWLFGRRSDVSISIDRALLGLRAMMFDALGVTLPTPDTGSPWRPMMRVMGAEHFPEAQLRSGVQWARAIGAYDRATYDRATIAPAMIARLVRQFRARGASVIVVLTPEHSWLRSREPAGIAEVIAQRLRQEAGAPDLRVIDFRAAIPDNGMIDLSHPNSAGSRAFSARLGEEVGPPDRRRPPLMAGR